MRVGLLGVLEVRDDDETDVLVAGAKLRSLLAVLALQVGRVVPSDHLVDALWGEDPPPGVRNGLQGLASKLRRALGSTEVIAMRGGGYVLELPPGAVDVQRFEQLIAAGRAASAAGDAAGSVTLLAEADALWRGTALADFAYEEFAAPVIARLSELRLSVIEERLEAELELGRHQGAVVELESLVTEHPLRERLRGLLMIAFYRAGRQADALRVFQDGRHILGEELGLEPGPELRRLEAAVLAQDPSLDAPVATDSRAPVPQRHPTIPAALTPMVGRDEELREITALFTEHRLVTLVGPGGVGKTRLAVEVGRAEAAALTYGGCLVELAPVGDPSGVRAAIASALDVPDSSQLAEVIGDRDLLIVLDNCEHLIATAAEITEDLLQRCPGLRVLATSREALRVGGETVWSVPPLSADDAAQLFVARAHAAGARLEVSDDLLPTVAEVCARLDGLPLAIELAAARTRAFPIQQIASRLNDRFRLLTGGSRTALPRQQTLRAVVDWSYDLLFENEQQVFDRLSVFPGGCDLATAEAICADDTLVAADVDDIIDALVDKSLVVAVHNGDDLRYTQLQTLAQYGAERLTERGESARIHNAMAGHFARLCAQSAAAFTGDSQREWLTAINQEQDNLRAALEWAIANDDAETALTIAGGVSWRHWLAGTVIEGKRWLDDAFACGGEAQEATQGLALMARGFLYFLAGSPANSDADLEAALAIFRDRNDVPAIALTSSFYAELAFARGDTVEARRRRVDVLTFYVGLPDEPFVLAARAYSRAILAILDGDLVEAEQQYREAAAGFSRRDRPVLRTICLGMLADFDERAFNYASAIEELEEAVELSDALQLKGFSGALLSRLAWVLLLDGNVERAETMTERSLDLGRRLRNAPVVFVALTSSALVHRHHGRNGDAAAAASEALELYQAGGPRRFGNRIDPEFDLLAGASACCAVLAVLAADEGKGDQAAQLLGCAERLSVAAGAPMLELLQGDIERARDAAMALLGHDAFVAAFEQGRRGELGKLVGVSASG